MIKQKNCFIKMLRFLTQFWIQNWLSIPEMTLRLSLCNNLNKSGTLDKEALMKQLRRMTNK